MASGDAPSVHIGSCRRVPVGGLRRYVARLAAKGDTLQGFELAGRDGHFMPATARIDGNTVVVNSSRVGEAKYVRYGWANAPVINLFNSGGLPASPFRTDDTPYTTQPKK